MRHVGWLTDSGSPITISDGRLVEVWEFNYKDDESILSEWAKHFRNQYCSDEEIDDLRDGTGQSRSEYLLAMKFPDQSNAPGPSIRAGDFAEILVADFLEYNHKYWIPRTRYSDKTIRNESTKGSDVIGFKFKIDPDTQSDEDELIVFEAKAQFSGDSPKMKLNEAIEGSIKDAIRLGESLNAIKQRLRLGGTGLWRRISRFQASEDAPFSQVFGAAAIFSSQVFDRDHIRNSTSAVHPPASTVKLLVIHGIKLMDLASKLYKLASDEA